MKTAVLYLRVSTEEQASKGFSLRAQQEILSKYCELNGITIRKIFTEDYSAKTFKRPEWVRLMIYLRRQKSDLLLFTKWDRFSRNSIDAYQMIGTLKKIGIDLQAVEQPLDLTVPENKLMLAFYLTTPEIENDHRSLNTKIGIRKSKKEGNLSGRAPLGYKNKTCEDGKKYIDLVEPAASIIRWAFDQLSLGIFSAAQIHRQATEKGLKCSINNFYSIIRNPIYCGKIRLSEFNNEETKLIKGLHEPLITESKFHRIQNILDGKVKGRGLPIAAPHDLPLRVFLKCPTCSRKLTGSASKGRKMHVVYYHCKSPCKIRFNANALNRSFSEELKLFTTTKHDRERLKQIIINSYDAHKLTIKETRKEYRNKMDGLDDQIIQAREFLMQGTIDATDFKAIKKDYQEKIELLQTNLSELNNQFDSKIDMANLIEQALKNLSNLRNIYEEASVEGKRSLVGMIFLEPIVYDGEKYRTTLINELPSIIYLKNKELQEYKKGEKHLKKILFPSYGSLMVQINSLFIADLKRLADLKRKMGEFDELGKQLKLTNSRPQK